MPWIAWGGPGTPLIPPWGLRVFPKQQNAKLLSSSTQPFNCTFLSRSGTYSPPSPGVRGQLIPMLLRPAAAPPLGTDNSECSLRTSDGQAEH